MKTKLNKRTRNELIAFARTKISFPELKAEVDNLYKFAEGPALDAVYGKFPPDVMKHLVNYDVAYRLSSAFFRHDQGGAMDHRFEFENEQPWVPHSANNYFIASQETVFRIRDYRIAEKFHHETITKQLDAYKKLVWSAVFFEDLTPIWPEAADLIPTGTALVANIDQEAAKLVSMDYQKRVEARMVTRVEVAMVGGPAFSFDTEEKRIKAVTDEPIDDTLWDRSFRIQQKRRAEAEGNGEPSK